MASDPFASLYAVDPFASLYGGEEESEEERLRREARERIQRNLRIGAEQAARLDLPERGGSTPGEALGSTLWGDTLGGLAELGALPGNVGRHPGFPGIGLPNPFQMLPESYKEKSQEVSEAAEGLRGRADTARQEAGMSPTLSALSGVVAENPDLITGVGAAGRGLGRAGLRQLDDLGRLVEEGVERGVREGAQPLGRSVGAPPPAAMDPLKQATLDAAEAKADLLAEMSRLKPEDLPVMQQAIQDAEVLARLGHPEEAQQALSKLKGMMDRTFPSEDVADLARRSDEIFEQAKAKGFEPERPIGGGPILGEADPLQRLDPEPVAIQVSRYGDPEEAGGGIWFNSRHDPSMGDADYYKGRRSGGHRIEGLLRPQNPLVLEGGHFTDFAGEATLRHFLGDDGLGDLMKALSRADLEGRFSQKSTPLQEVLRQYGSDAKLPARWDEGMRNRTHDLLATSLARKSGYDAIVHQRANVDPRLNSQWADEVVDLSSGRNFTPGMPSGRAQSPPTASAASVLPVDASRPVDASEAVLRVSTRGRSAAERAARPALTPGAERAAFDAEEGGAGSAALTDWLRKNMRSFGEYQTVAEGFVDPRIRKYIGETLPRRVEQSGNEERLLLRQMQLLSREIDQATAQVAKASGGQVSPAQLRRQMDAARRSGDYTSLPPELQPVAQKAGAFLDNLSQQYIDLGVVDEGMADTFRSNMGRYMHTSHAAFDRPGFLEEVRGTKAWDEARAFVKSEIPDATEDEVVGLLESLADRKQPRPLGFGKKSGLGRKDLTNLIQKEEIPEPIRELLGVYRDYRVNFERGTAKMAHTIAEHRLLRDVAEELESMGVLRQASPTTGKGEAGFYRQITGGPERSPIEDYYTTPQVADLLQGVLEQSRSTWYSYLSGAVKFFKVAASPQTQLRNWESGFLMSMANGNFVANPRHLVRTAQVQKTLVTQVPGGTESRMLKFLGAADAVELEADIGKAIELGVIQRSAQGKEFASYVEEIGQGPQGLRRMVENKPVGYLSRAYMAGDDFWKFANWKAEMDKLGWAYGGQAPREALEREAAEIVSQQLQTYDRVMPLARKLSRNPLVGPFATFHLEMPRNLVNIFRRSGVEYGRAKEALAAGDTAAAARWTAVATQRMAGVGAALTMFGAYKTYVNKKNGITGDKEEAFRRLALPPYAENSQAVVVEVDGDDVTYFDSQFADPYNIVQRLWVAAVARPGDPAERTMRAAEELARTFLGPELLTSTVVGQVANQDLSTGRPITYESRPPERQIMDRAEHAWRGLAPGGAITAERLGRAAAGQEPYDLGREAVAVVGPRWRTTNVRESFGFKVGDFNEARRRISTDYNAQSTNRDGTPKGAEEVQAALAEAERSWKRSYGEMQEYVTDLKNWGLSDSEVYKELTGRKVRADLARKLVSGQFMDYGTYRRSIN